MACCPGGRAASASERVSRPRLDSVVRPPLVELVETTDIAAPEALEMLLHRCRKCRLPGPGVSVLDARIPCMATVFGEPEAHPIAAAVARIHTELELRVARQAECLDLGAEAGAADTGSYWADQTRQTKRDAKRRLQLAHALDHDHEPVRDAMAAGQVSEEQAAVIVKGVDALPVEHRRDAEAHLIGCAAEHDPVALRRLAHRVLEVVAPEIAEAHELQALQRQEALAEEACRFTIADDGHGLCHGRFTLPSPVGAMLKQAVLAYAAPKHRQHSGTPQGLGHAFSEYVTRYP